MSTLVKISRYDSHQQEDVVQEYLINTRESARAAQKALHAWIDHGHANFPFADNPITIQVFDHEIGA